MKHLETAAACIALGLGCQCLSGELVNLPGTTVPVTDPTTGIPMSVRISPLAVGRNEVTQREYASITGRNPSIHKGDDLPVENVSWWDAIRYCNLRSLAEKLEPCYDLVSGKCDRTGNGYRLLSETEWVYAAGKSPGRQDTAKYGTLGPADTKDTALLMQYARTHTTKAAGSLLPNEHGLYDLIGNVWEWVQDFQDPSGAVPAVADPEGPRWGTARVVRGGSYLSTT
jgi:formylglycine-generating enzyme required for sulfatase activity